jgi:hypothetical protein
MTGAAPAILCFYKTTPAHSLMDTTDVTIDEYITSLRKKNNITVAVENGELSIRGPKKDLTKEIIEGIRGRKTDILDFFAKVYNRSETFSIPPAGEQEYYALSSAQKRLFFLHELDKSSLAYNMPQRLTLEGPCDAVQLERVFGQLAERHESLRTYFETMDGVPVQKIAGQVNLQIEHFTQPEADLAPVADTFVRPFELNRAPLMRVGLVQAPGREPVLLVDMHHIITDAASNEMLLEEFKQLYGGQQLPPLKLQYKDYAEWQNKPAEQSRIARQSQYWVGQLQGALPVLNLPLDYPRLEKRDDRGGYVTTYLSEGEYELPCSAWSCPN